VICPGIPAFDQQNGVVPYERERRGGVQRAYLSDFEYETYFGFWILAQRCQIFFFDFDVVV
jgi:hypothetical protein